GDHDSLIRIPKISEWVLEEGSAFLHHNPEYSKLPFFKERSTSVMCKLHPVTPVKKCSSFISKKKFGIPDGLTSFLFFGLIRPYKGLDTLLDAIEQLPDKTPVAFLIGGEPWRDKKRIEKRLNKISKKFWIHSKLEWIAEQESSQWFSAADAVVCPYVKATGSGVLSQALAFEKPVLTTDTGSLAHVVTHGKNGLLSQPKSSIELCRNIQLFLEPSVRRTLQSGSRNQKKHSWDDYVSGVIHLAKNSANRVSRETPWTQ
ncbi:MAG: glycosyltransferase family 4 protein, partial [Deltaproteobacteria bacterium]